MRLKQIDFASITIPGRSWDFDAGVSLRRTSRD